MMMMNALGPGAERDAANATQRFAPTDYDARPAFDARWKHAARGRAKRGLQGVIWLVLALAGWVSSRRVRRRSPLRAGDAAIRRILLIRLDLIGDVVLSTPALSAMRRAYPIATVDVLVLPSTAGVLAGDPRVTRVITYDPNVWRRPIALLRARNWRQARDIVARLRARDYDLCLSLAGDWASVLAWLSGARRRVGYADEAYPGLMTDPLPGGRYQERRHEVTYIQTLARAAGGVLDNADLPRLHVQASADVALAETLKAACVPVHRPLIALHPGARNGKAKRWPTEYWTALAGMLARALDATVLLVGAPGERETSRQIARNAGAPIYDLTGKTSIQELVALCARCDLVISGDSGPMHIACAVDTPLIGLFGPTDPCISGPLGPNAIVMRQPIWCGPCYDASTTADCRFHNPVCMKALSAHAVFAAARRQLATRLPMASTHAQTRGQEVFSAPHTRPRPPTE